MTESLFTLVINGETYPPPLFLRREPVTRREVWLMLLARKASGLPSKEWLETLENITAATPERVQAVIIGCAAASFAERHSRWSAPRIINHLGNCEVVVVSDVQDT